MPRRWRPASSSWSNRRGSVPGVEGDELTIDQLAAQVDMTVRNIRAHQARGLLPPPRIRGRVGYYGPAHRRRLEQIRAMQDEGLNLAAISMVLHDGQLPALSAELFDELEPQWFDADDLLARLGLSADDPAVATALAQGVVTVDGDRIRMDRPRTLPIAEEFVAMGVPVAAQLEALEQVRAATAQVAAAYLKLAEEHLVARVAVDAGGDLEAVRTSVARLRDLARSALISSFDEAMAAALRMDVEASD